MNTKFIIGAIIGTVVFSLLGFLIWGLALSSILSKYGNTACMRPEEDLNILHIIVSNLFWALSFSYVFSKSNVSSVGAGATMGAVLSVLLGISIDLFMYTFSTMITSLVPAAINIPANAVYGAIAGAVMGWWFARK